MKCIGEKCIKSSFYDDVVVCYGNENKPNIVIPNKDICQYAEKIINELKKSISDIRQYLNILNEQLQYFQGDDNK